MRRREFLVGSAGAVASLGSTAVFAQAVPCPVPSLVVDEGQSVTTTCTSVALVEACARLTAGQSASYPSGVQTAFTEADMAWQTAFHHDALHNVIHLMGKPANDHDNWKHQIFDMAGNKWGNIETGMWNNPGHIYGNFAMDYSTGDLYITRGGMDGNAYENSKRARSWRFSTRSWDRLIPASQDIYAGALVSHANGVAFHPDLYGSRDGGLVIDTQFRTLFWRKSTDAVQNVSHSTDAYGNNEGASCYSPSHNAVFVGGADGGQLLRVTPGSGTPTVTALARPPIQLSGSSYLSSNGFGSLHVHPGNPRKLVILETNGQRAWESETGTSWAQIANHPFDLTPRVVCSLRGGLGTFWALGTRGSTQYSVLWKPRP